LEIKKERFYLKTIAYRVIYIDLSGNIEESRFFDFLSDAKSLAYQLLSENKKVIRIEKFELTESYEFVDPFTSGGECN